MELLLDLHSENNRDKTEDRDVNNEGCPQQSRRGIGLWVLCLLYSAAALGGISASLQQVAGN